jgi:hypothetical protein
MVRLLLGRGADINPVNRKQFTPLDEARYQMQSGSTEAAEIERLLLASGGVPAGAAAAPATP